MNHDLPVLRDLMLLAAVAFGVLLVCQRLRLPPLLGFIFTGIVAGPRALGWVHDEKLVRTLAEFGVVLLLFTVGLEFSLADLRRLGRSAYVGGALQLALVVAAVTGVLLALGRPLPEAVFAGMLVSISSTAVVLKQLSERGELDAPHGRLSTAVLILQDLVCIAYVVVAPSLPQLGRAPSLGGLLDPAGSLRVLAAALTAGLLLVVAQRAIPWLVRRASRAGSREAFLFGVVLVVLGSARLAEWAGASLAIGAFLAGLALAGSELRSQVAAEVLSFRDALASVFFVAIGMSLDLRVVAAHPWPVLGTVVGLVALKLATGAVAFRAAGTPLRIGAAAALATAQVGEFSFLLLQIGRPAGLLDETGAQIFTAGAVCSLALSPLLIARANGWALTLAASAPAGVARGGAHETPKDHVVIAGFGLNGSNVARVLRATRVPHLVLDLNAESARRAEQAGSPALVGDVTHPAIQRDAGIADARVLVLALSDPVATRHACRIARAQSPRVFILVRTRYVAEIDQLHAVGANQVIPEEFETSIEIFTSVLREYHVPANVVTAQIRLLRQERYSLMRGQKLPASVLEQLDALLAEGVTDTVRLLQHSPGIGRSLGQLEFGGVRVIAVVRGGEVIAEPPADLVLRVGDSVVLTGSHAAMEQAFEVLNPVAENTSLGH